MDSSNCPITGSFHAPAWDVRGFYEHKFNDPMNFNLGENTVSAITAVLTSISLLLFTDMMFRVLVRAKNGRISKRVVNRRHALENSSNPLTLLGMIISVLRMGSNRQAPPQAPNSHLGRWKLIILSFIGVLMVCVEFLFIFLSTNQKRVYDVRLDTVPVFEFEDRGCSPLDPVQLNICSSQGPVTQKAGFDPRAYFLVCSWLSTSRHKFEGTFGSERVFLRVSVDFISGVHVHLFDDVQEWGLTTKLGVVLENGFFFSGMPNATEGEILRAVSARLQRANATVVAPTRLSSRVISGLDQPESPYPILSVFLTLGTARIDLNETEYANIPDTGNALGWYLLHVINSVMFPSGEARGMYVFRDKLHFLDEAPVPIAYYNRPWMGIVASLILCGVLVVAWVMATALGLEGGVDPRWAWKEFFSDTHDVEDFGKGNDETQGVGWRQNRNGVRVFGFTPAQ